MESNTRGRVGECFLGWNQTQKRGFFGVSGPFLILVSSYKTCLRTGMVLRGRGVALRGVALSQDSVAVERTRSLPPPLPAPFPFSPQRAHTQHMYNSTPQGCMFQDCSAQMRTREPNPAPAPLTMASVREWFVY